MHGSQKSEEAATLVSQPIYIPTTHQLLSLMGMESCRRGPGHPASLRTGSEQVCPVGLAISGLLCGRSAFSVLGLPDPLCPLQPHSTLRTPAGVICTEKLHIHWRDRVGMSRPLPRGAHHSQDVVSHCQPFPESGPDFPLRTHRRAGHGSRSSPATQDACFHQLPPITAT